MGRKRNQGKARRAAKEAKAREREDGRQKIREENEKFKQRLLREEICTHGCDKIDNRCLQFAKVFREAFREGADDVIGVVPYLLAAYNATRDEFADVWNDYAKMEMAMSYFLSEGTKCILELDHLGLALKAPVNSVLARFLEQHIAVHLKQTQALYNW